jgi:hypothetical protein
LYFCLPLEEDYILLRHLMRKPSRNEPMRLSGVQSDEHVRGGDKLIYSGREWITLQVFQY